VLGEERCRVAQKIALLPDPSELALQIRQLFVPGLALSGEGSLARLPQLANPRPEHGRADPEISRDDLGDLIAFTRFLAPPAPKPFNAAASLGAEHFEAIGCTKCHVPELPTTRFGTIRPYTDLLLHEMGEDLADNTPRQIHLQRLMGLPEPLYLHTPLVMGIDGHKLSKQNGAAPLDVSDPVAALQQAARVLELPRIEALSVSEWLSAAIRSWATRWVA